MTTERSSSGDSNVDAVFATREDTMLDTRLDDGEQTGQTSSTGRTSGTSGTGSTGSSSSTTSTTGTSGTSSARRPAGGQRSATGTDGGDRLAEAAGGVAERVADTAQRQVGSQVEGGLRSAGDVLEQLALAVRRGGDEMRSQQPQLAGFADTAAGQVDKAAQFVRQTDFQGVIREAESFARRQPAVFLGGALALGLLASRFLKASPAGGASRQMPGGYTSRYSSTYGMPYGSQDLYGTPRSASSDIGYDRTSAPADPGSTLGAAGGSLASRSTGVEHGGR